MPRKKTEVRVSSCPFCGSDPEIIPWHGGGPNKHRIGCVDDQCTVAPSVTAYSRPEAIAIWNKRSIDGLQMCRDLAAFDSIEARLKAAEAECNRLRRKCDVLLRQKESWQRIVTAPKKHPRPAAG